MRRYIGTIFFYYNLLFFLTITEMFQINVGTSSLANLRVVECPILDAQSAHELKGHPHTSLGVLHTVSTVVPGPLNGAGTKRI